MPNDGYVLVLFVVVAAFVAVMAAMQVLVLTSVATTSRAYDAYRQGATELVRLECAVTETLLEQRQVSVPTTVRPLTESLTAHLADISAAGASISTISAPATLPQVNSFPDLTSPADRLEPAPNELAAFMTPELAWLAGPRIATYPEVQFEFATERPVLDAERVYRVAVRARLLAVPITRFPIAAYDLPSEIGATLATAAIATTATTATPHGLVPGRDNAFVPDLQAQAGVLPYHFRRRAVLSTAYQYVFSQAFVDRVAEYAGPTHFCDLDAPATTAVLAGMNTGDTTTRWDLAEAGIGTAGTTSDARDASVVFTRSGGKTLRLYDTSANPDRPPLLLLILGPADLASGSLTLELATITRPVVIIACNVRVTAEPGTAVSGALLLDPNSSFAGGTTLTIGHLSYWGGMPGASQVAITNGVMPLAAEAMAPRVVYVGTQAAQL